MKILGLDIGGANTDWTIINIEDKHVTSLKNNREYLPMWKNKEELKNCLNKITKEDTDIDVVCVSMTAELADDYLSKTEGVNDISKKVMELFENKIVYFVTFNGLKTYEEIQKDPLSCAAANWIGTANILKYLRKDFIFMDIGSTTTDIIPIKNQKEIAEGHTDLERLSCGELIYTGMLRTNLTSIVHELPVNNKITRTSSELFSISADMHIILGNITPEDYTCTTPDNKGKDLISCKRRLARLVCADLDMLSDYEIINMAKYIEVQQINQIYYGLKEVVERTKIKTVLITSLGEGNLCQKAAEKLNLEIISLENYIPKKVSNVLTAVGAVQMYLDKINEKIVLIEEIKD